MTETKPGSRAGAAARHLDRRRRRGRQRTSATATADCSWSPSRGRACCAASGATRSGSWRPTGRSSQKQGYYFAGDGARLDDDGDVWLLGRVDDVMNVSGHRLSTTEIESALVAQRSRRRGRRGRRIRRDHRPGGRRVRHHQAVATSPRTPPDGLAQSLRAWVGEQIGPIARPRDVYIVERAAQDPLRQDHAPPAARCRRGPRGRRHDDARRHRRDERDLAQVK